MKKNMKFILGLLSSALAVIPFVVADLRAGPEVVIIPVVALSLLAGFVVGAVFLILWIVRTIRNKNKKITPLRRKRK